MRQGEKNRQLPGAATYFKHSNSQRDCAVESVCKHAGPGALDEAAYGIAVLIVREWILDIKLTNPIRDIFSRLIFLMGSEKQGQAILHRKDVAIRTPDPLAADFRKSRSA